MTSAISCFFALLCKLDEALLVVFPTDTHPGERQLVKLPGSCTTQDEEQMSKQVDWLLHTTACGRFLLSFRLQLQAVDTRVIKSRPAFLK